jgi:hypothetical protein
MSAFLKEYIRAYRDCYEWTARYLPPVRWYGDFWKECRDLRREISHGH